MSEYLAGIAEITITPPIGVEMAGYSGRQKPASGIHDELKAVAVVFDDRSGQKSAICAVDLCMLNATLVAAVRERVHIAARPERILIAATHDHSGPAIVSENLLNQRWLKNLEDALVQVIMEADHNRRDARIGTAVGAVSGIGGNRRDPEHGAVDRSVTVMRLDDARTGKVMGIIVSHACHATTLGLDNYLITADYPGQVRAYVQGLLPDKPLVLFLNGACGDINPGGYSAEASALGKKIPNRTFKRSKEIGALLGAEAVRLAKTIKTRGEFYVLGGALPVRLPTRKFKLPAEADRDYEAVLKKLKPAEKIGLGGKALDQLRLDLMYAKTAAKYARRYFNLPNGELTTEVQGIVVDDTIFVGLPGEVFTELGLALKKDSPFKTTFIVGYANDSTGYFPTVEALARSGYEVKVSLFGAVAIERMVGWARLLMQGLARSLRQARAQAVSTKPAAPAGAPDWIRTSRPVSRAKFPAIDFHLHCWGAWRSTEYKLAQMAAANVAYAVSLVGDAFPDARLEPALAEAANEKGKLLYFSGFDFRRLDEPDWPDYVRRKLDHDLKLGVKGIKLFKEVGLTYRDSLGNLIRPIDRRLAPIWQAAAERDLPVLYHIADPLRAFTPLAGNYEEIKALQAGGLFWKFGAPGHPTHEQLLQDLEQLAAENPATTFVFAHLASMDGDLARCTRLLQKNPRVYVDTAARLAELGRQPHTAREFFMTNPGRILFGSDYSWPNRYDGYPNWFRFLETPDESFTCQDFGAPPKWGLYGINLPDDVLRKVYGENAAQLLKVKL